MENTTNVPISVAILKLQEVVDDMTQALGNLAKVKNQTKLMCKIIKDSKDADQFKEFLAGSEKDIADKEKEYETLLAHRQLLINLVERYKSLHLSGKYEQARELDDTVRDIFYAFNMLHDEEPGDKEESKAN